MAFCELRGRVVSNSFKVRQRTAKMRCSRGPCNSGERETSARRRLMNWTLWWRRMGLSNLMIGKRRMSRLGIGRKD